MIRRPPRSTLFPYTRSSDLPVVTQSTSCDKALKNLGAAVEKYVIVEGKPPPRLVALYRAGYVESLDKLLCPGSSKTIESENEVAAKSDFELLPATGERGASLVAVRPQAGEARRVYRAGGRMELSDVPGTTERDDAATDKVSGTNQPLTALTQKKAQTTPDTTSPPGSTTRSDTTGTGGAGKSRSSTAARIGTAPSPGAAHEPVPAPASAARPAPAPSGGGGAMLPRPQTRSAVWLWVVGGGLSALLLATAYLVVRQRVAVPRWFRRRVRPAPKADRESPKTTPATPATLEIKLPDGTQRSFPLQDFPILIGRREDCDLVLPDLAASRLHARILKEAGSLVIVDVGSTAGTQVDGKRVARAPLVVGTIVTIGDTRIEVI